MVYIAALLSFFLRFFVLNVIAIGQYRYVMETRFSRDVPWQRMLAPFHLKTLLIHFLLYVLWIIYSALMKAVLFIHSKKDDSPIILI